MKPVTNIERKVIIHSSLKGTWDFFADPRNNKKIMPPGATFKRLTANADHLYPGLIVEHMEGMGDANEVYGVTEIPVVDPCKYFIDIHHYGMFKFWHHQHHFAEVAGGTEMRDIIHVEPGSNFPGTAADAKAMMNGLFDYRDKVLNELLAGK